MWLTFIDRVWLGLLYLGNCIDRADFNALCLVGAFFRINFHVIGTHGNGAFGAFHFAGSANNAFIRNLMGHRSVPFKYVFLSAR
jgi:hypothetical protein